MEMIMRKPARGPATTTAVAADGVRDGEISFRSVRIT
jgi:hypothetical protein